jgi:hypothetical protein
MDLKGKVFNRWTVIEYTGKSNISGSYLWKCICNCGNYGEIAASALNAGGSKSCGCLSVDVNRKRMVGKPSIGKKPKLHVAQSRIFKFYRDNSSRRGHEFKINREDFIRLTTQNCFYCGVEPKQGTKNKLGEITFKYNGLDRIDSGIGYQIDNVVTCCHKCNRAKYTMSQSEFYLLVERIYLNKIASK